MSDCFTRLIAFINQLKTERKSKQMKKNIYVNEAGNLNMHLVSKYAHILFEIKCETDINDAFCHEMENALDDSGSIFTKINRLTLNVFTEEYLRTIKRLEEKFSQPHSILTSDNILSCILENDCDLRKNGDIIKIRREELENLILDFGNILKKLTI